MNRFFSFIAAATLAGTVAAGTPVGETFTYQGRLTESGAPFTGTADVTFALFDAETLGVQIGSTLSIPGLAVNEGLIIVDLDFGAGAFDGNGRWLEVTVDANVLVPRQPILPAPYAIRALSVPAMSISTQAIAADAVTNVELASDAASMTKVSGGAVSINGGNVGVGTAAPGAKLHLADLGAAHVIIDADTNNGGGEDQNARIIMRQDGGLVSGRFGYRQGLNTLELMQESTEDLILGTSDADRITIKSGGAVGIGTDSPNGGTALTLQGVGANSGWLQFTTSGGVNEWHVTNEGAGLNFVESGVATNRLVLTPGGGVGIGTSSTSTGRLAILQDQNDSSNGISVLNSTQVRTARLWVDGSDVAHLDSGTTGTGTFTINEGGGLVRVAGAPGGARVEMDDSGSGAQVNVYNDTGALTVELDSANGAGNGFIQVNNSTGANRIEMVLEGSDDGSIRVKNSAGATVIELDADFGGEGRIFTEVLEITGGSDLSEQFDVANADRPVEPGDVVCIDPDRPGSLTVSTRACDRTVAGVVSGAGGVRTGMLMGQRDSVADGAHPVALTGRVYVKVDATHGAVRPGDLLTTSPTPGHAMVVTEHGRAAGAILGKAMTGLDRGTGLVLVLVTLQ